MEDDAIDDPGDRRGKPGFAISDDTPIVAERVRVRARLDTPPEPVPVRPAALSEIPVLAGVLARAFAADPMVCWPMVTDDELPRRIRTTFEIVDTAYAGEGWIYTAGEGLGVMSLMPPASAKREQELAVATAPAIAALTPDGGRRYDRFWTWVSAMLPPEPRWLLDQVAVEPAAQGQGIGGAMLRVAIERAERDELPLCLETGVPGNVPLYQRFGFSVTRAADAPEGGPHIWFLRRGPG
jgi:GNAT superfamily N-acetyltransferase